MDSNNQNEQVTKDLREQGIDQEEQDIDLSEIKDLIVKFNLDSSIEKLKEYYSTPTTWEIIGKSRSETCHTQFLARFFGNRDFNANLNIGPIKKLIVLLLKWANMQNGAQFDEKLATSIYSQKFSIISYNVIAERPIFLDKPLLNGVAYGDGNIDIFIKCTAMVNDKEKNINIVIENKIDAPETKKCFDSKGNLLKKPNKKNTKTYLHQTDAYYQYITDKYKEDKGNINIFVYLKPTDRNLEDITEAECNCKKYIQINYQELLDNIIQPVSEQKDISVENRFRLKDYIKTLGTPSETENGTEDTDDDTRDNSNNKIIMAMGQKEKELLTTFFKNNEDLILAALKALGDPELSERANNVTRKGRSKNTYTINNQDRYTMYEVLEEFVKYRLNVPSVSVQDIDDEIRRYIGSSRVNVSDDPAKPVMREEKGFGCITVHGREIKYTKQWSDGGSNPTFTRFREKVSDGYPDFQIDII